VAIGLDVGVEFDGAVVVVEVEGRGLWRVEPRGDLLDVGHRRRERDDSRIAEPAEAGDGDLQRGAASLGVQQVDLVDDDGVHVRDEVVAVGVVLARRRVDLLRRHHEDVRPAGAARIEVALARDDVDRVAQFLEAVPLRLLLVRQRAHRRDEQGGAAAVQGLADRQLRDRRLAAGGRRARDHVLVGLEHPRDRRALHRVELVEGEGVGEGRQDLGDFHLLFPAA
jgi:hypothetical protein